MARFIKTPNVWNVQTQLAIEAGELVLQPGQWVYCGFNHKMSRFVSFNPDSKTMNIAHGGTIKEVNTMFAKRIAAKRKQQEIINHLSKLRENK